MTILELLTIVGSDNITFQTLDTDIVEANLKSKGATITFATDPKLVKEMALSNKPPPTVGYVLWMPRDLLPAP